MKRRGFLGLMGGAAVAGPSMAKQAVASGLEAMQVGDATTTGSPWTTGRSLGVDIGYEPPSPMDADHWLQVELREFLGMSDEEKKRLRSELHVHALDPDLVANRSFSLSAKLRIQRDRDFARSMVNREQYIRRQLADAIKLWTKKGLLK